MARSRLHRRYVKTPKHNPPLFTDLAEFVIPGFGGFAATRFLTRIAGTQVAQRAPSWGKHAGAVVSVSSFLAAWFFAHRVKWLEKYHTPIVVGSAIAAAQSLLQLYAPNLLGWIVSDASPEIAAATTGKLSTQDQQLAQMNLLPTNEDPNEFRWDDMYDAGRYSGPNGPGSMKPDAIPTSPKPSAAPQSSDDLLDSAMADAIGTANLGVFANN